MDQSKSKFGESDQSLARERDLTLSLFQRSPLKRQKLRFIERLLPDSSKLDCLDVGGDNGATSYLLRERGGWWVTVDLGPAAIGAIKRMVGQNVVPLAGAELPFSAQAFDLIVVVDYLEHIERDRHFVEELSRVIRPNGTLIINVPSPREGWWRRFKAFLGQTDGAHGHVRPGYGESELRGILEPYFELGASVHYRRWFSDLVDTLMTTALDLMQGQRSPKGNLVTGSDLRKKQKLYRIYALLAPFLGMMVWLDEVLPWTHPNMLIVKATRIREQC